MMGAEPYYHARLAEKIAESKELNLFKLTSEDIDLSFEKRPYDLNPYHALLSVAGSFGDISAFSKILPPILGILTLLLFAGILGSVGMHKLVKNITLLMLALCPAFIYTFTVSNPHSFAIFLTLLAVYLLLKQSHLLFLVSLPAIALCSMFSIFNTTLILVLILSFLTLGVLSKERFLVASLLSILVGVFYPNHFFYEYVPAQTSIIASLVSDLGGMPAFGLFSIILAVFGFPRLWKSKSKIFAFIITPLLMMPLLWVYGSSILMYISFFLALVSAVGFVTLVEMRWQLRTVQSLSIIIVLCGLMFSTASFMNRLVYLPPNQDMGYALEWLGSRSEEGVVLSHPDYGYWIESISKKQAFSDTFSTSGYSQDFYYKTTETIFRSRNLDDTKILMKRFGVKYILIDADMKQGLVWSRENEGLLFLLSDSETFKNIYKLNGIELWEVLE
jgi:hypothetical protein